MNKSYVDAAPAKEFLTINQATNALWEWRKYRNVVFWKTVYRMGTAVLVLTLVPYLLPYLISKLGFAVFVFPALAFLLAVFAAYLMAVQYKLYKQVDRIYRSLLGKYNPEEISNDKPINRVLRLSFGKVLVTAFLFFGIILELINGLVLLHLINGAAQ